MATPVKDDRKSNFPYKHKADYESDWLVHKNYIQSFESYEAMLIGVVYDSVSGTIDSSKITDSYSTTLAKERADRVVAKLPEGIVQPAGKADAGKAAYMDILRTKWIYPNANAQHPFLEKLNMWQFYSSVYGYMPMFYDWNVSATGYVGPDAWLWNPRNLVPQQGRSSIADMEYVTALTWVNKSYLQNILDGLADETDDDGWDKEALKEIVAMEEGTTGPDFDQDTKVTRDRQLSQAKRGVQLATRYEAGEDGEWIVFAPDHGYCELRRIKNPHKNGRIPFVIKYSQPLFDSFYGLGDFQRAKPLQFARDGLVNFYFKGIKMNLIPPIVANANGVVKHTLDYREGGVMLETIPNSIRRLETSTAGLATYQAAQTSLTGSLLAQFGSQSANAPAAETLNPSQGKTPAAIGLYSDKEATRDGSERRHLESAIEQLTEGFFSLVANIGTEDIPVTLFRKDVEDIERLGMVDVMELFNEKNLKPNASGTAAKLTIKPNALKGVDYRFKINPDSTAKINQQAQLQALMDMIDRLGKYQNILQEDPTITIHWDKIMSTFMTLTDIAGADQFITFDPDAKKEPEQPPVPQPEPLQTPVQLSNGTQIEAAELIKLYGQADKDPTLQIAIAQLLGLPSDPQEEETPEQQPTVDSQGNSFQDPHIAAVSEALNGAAAPLTGSAAPEAEEAQPTIDSQGVGFNDPHIAAVSDALNNAAAPLTTPAAQPPTPPSA